MLEVLGREHAEDEGDVALEVQPSDPLCHPRTNVVEMWRITPNDATDDDHDVDVLRLGHHLGAESELEATRHALDVNVFLLGAMTLQRVAGAFQEFFGDVLIPL